jgi:hypothetical protein
MIVQHDNKTVFRASLLSSRKCDLGGGTLGKQEFIAKFQFYLYTYISINQSIYLFPLILYTRYGKRHNDKSKQC